MLPDQRHGSIKVNNKALIAFIRPDLASGFFKGVIRNVY